MTATLTLLQMHRLVEYKSDNKASTNSAITTSYTYDNIGNRLSKDDGTLLKYKYNEFNFLSSILDEDNNVMSSYYFDANGNQIKEESDENIIEFEYDVLNRLSKTSISSVGQSETLIESEDEGQDDSSSLDASKSLVSVTENLYNGIGKRIKKTVTKANTDNTNLGGDDLDYESTGDAINESTEGLNETVNKEPWVTNTTNYFYQDGVVSYTTNEEGDKTSHNLIGTEDNIITTKRYGSDEGFYSYNKDLQGSITTVLDSEGEFKTGYQYTDFGETTKFGDNEFYNEVCYTGGIYDEDTELYYLNARYYDPANSRFLSQDTYRGEQADPRSLHLYAYCSNDPINFVDPSGHTPLGIIAGTALGSALSFRWGKKQKFWYTTKNATQKIYGYCNAYDTAAKKIAHFKIKTKKIYIQHKKKVWRIQLWKGSYWGAAGGEVGTYYRNGKYNANTKGYKHYRSVSNKDSLKMSLSVYKGSKRLFKRKYQKHWWLNGFKPFTSSSNLKLKTTIKLKKGMKAGIKTKGYKSKVRGGKLKITW